MRTRVFHVNYLAGLRTAQRRAVSSGSTSGTVAGQPGAGGGGGAPVPAGTVQPGQSVNTIGLANQSDYQ